MKKSRKKTKKRRNKKRSLRINNKNNFEETDSFWTIESVNSHPNVLFLFSDNDKDKNTNKPGGNQAVIRGRKNAFGIRTGYSPGFEGGYRDGRLSMNKKMIHSDLIRLKSKVNKINRISIIKEYN